MWRGGGAGNQGEARQERPADAVRRRGQQRGRGRSTAGEASEMEGATVRGKLAGGQSQLRIESGSSKIMAAEIDNVFYVVSSSL